MLTQQKHKKSSGIALLLLEDVHGLGRKGDVAESKPGFARNFLIPQGKALPADANALRKQENLRAEREKQAAVDKAISGELASQINGLTISYTVKVDPAGHMYGSVSAGDIVEILGREGIVVERRFVRIGQPLKNIGLHEIDLQLKEGVTCSFNLKVLGEGMEELPEEAAEVVAPIEEESTEEGEATDGEEQAG